VSRFPKKARQDGFVFTVLVLKASRFPKKARQGGFVFTVLVLKSVSLSEKSETRWLCVYRFSLKKRLAFRKKQDKVALCLPF
jgi:hypothetical protein